MDAPRLIREARRRAGLSQTALARRLGTKQPVIARWESSARSPSYEMVRRAVAACGFELGARLVPVDAGEDTLLREWLRLSPRERLARNLRMLEMETWARRARPAAKEAAGDA